MNGVKRVASTLNWSHLDIEGLVQVGEVGPGGTSSCLKKQKDW